QDAEGSVAAKNSKYFEYGLAAMGSLTEVLLAKGMAVGVAVGERYVLPGSSTSHWRSVLHALAELKLQPQHIWNYPVQGIPMVRLGIKGFSGAKPVDIWLDPHGDAQGSTPIAQKVVAA